MKLRDNQFIFSGARLVTMVTLAAFMAFAPVVATAGDKDAREDRAEVRIKDLHSKLKITAEQEAQWNQVADVMREDAKIMDALTATRFEHADEMTAVDDIKSYGEITAAHADGAKKLLPVFSALYSSMSDSQKKEADILFRRGDQKHDHKMKTKKDK